MSFNTRTAEIDVIESLCTAHNLPQFKSFLFILLKLCPCKCCGLSQTIWMRVRFWSNRSIISWILQSQSIAFRSMRKYCNAGNPSNTFGCKCSMLLWKSSLEQKYFKNSFDLLKNYNSLGTYKRCNSFATTFGISDANVFSVRRCKSVLCSTLKWRRKKVIKLN